MKTEEKIVVFQRDDNGYFFAHNGGGGYYWTPYIYYAADFSWTDHDNADQSIHEPGKVVEYTKITEYTPTGITGKDAFKEDN